MAEAASVIELNQRKKSGQDITKAYQSEEIVIAFSGAIGCGIKDVIKNANDVFSRAGYKVEHIRVSALIKKLYEANESDSHIKEIFDGDLGGLSGFERYDVFQKLGSYFRRKHNNGILAEAVVSDIATLRKSKEMTEGVSGFRRTAYFVDQLKNPAEVELLRLLYGNMFYLVGILSNKNDRVKSLQDEGVQEPNAISLIQRDRSEDNKYGQQLEKTLKEADYFIRHYPDNDKALRSHMRRLNNLIHGQKGITPTLDESGMFAAYSASLSSACMSRQVGAAICSPDGTIISTGCNDAPQGGGGLYTASSIMDMRCYGHKKYCRNDKKKKEISADILDILKLNGVDRKSAIKIIYQIEENTRIGSLTEFSRAIHAEMDAIIKVAKRDSTSTLNASLYTTTYPCHNCARHVVAAGFDRVVYVEPYEKSLAISLHDDAITTDEREYEASKNPNFKGLIKVLFIQFEGVAPKRYESFFKYKRNTKIDGKVSMTNVSEALQVEPVFTKAYHEIEKKILVNVAEILMPD